MEKIFTRKWLEIHKNGSHLLPSPEHLTKQICRFLTASEVSTALRPFYFSVHPDLFGQHPAERTVNENSLKQLSSHIETLQKNRTASSSTITFYLRPQDRTGKDVSKKSSFRSVRISLHQQSLTKTILSVLNTCNLPTTYIDNIVPLPDKKPRYTKEEKFYGAHFDENDPIFGSVILKQQIKKAKDAEKLLAWLDTNVSDVRGKLAACQPVREEVVRLQKELQDTLGIRKVVWDCGWNVTHFRGCLQSFQALARHHPDVMHVLKGRVVIFANNTGVSLKGHVMLNSGEVRHNWLDFIKNVPNQDEVFRRIPSFEKALSQVLRNILVVRRKFQPKVMAKQYESQLRRLITSLSDHQGRIGYPKHWPDSLGNFELVVEAEAGPLMLSPTGQFIVPSSCPAFLLIAFINDNLEEATRLLHHYKSNKHVERELHNRCVQELGLSALAKDDNITPDLMIACCERLLSHRHLLARSLHDTRLWVTHYYSVLSDGEMCIPWNWRI